MRTGGTVNDWKVVPLAPAAIDVFKSPDPATVLLGNPSVVALPGGRILVSLDLAGPGVKRLPGPKGRMASSGHWLQGKVLASADKGQTWVPKFDFPFHEARLFRVGGILYLLGLAGEFRIMKSADGGESWSRMEELALGEGEYVQPPSNILCARDQIYAVVLKSVAAGGKGEGGRSLVPVILRARQGSDLTNRKSWSWSEPGKPLHELAPLGSMDFFGVPFFPLQEAGADRGGGGRRVVTRRIGWDALHIVEIKDSHHTWHDPRGRALHIVSRAETHRSNLAALARMVEDETGRISIGLETTPAGTRMAFVPLPGGNLKFDLAYDDESKLFWLASNLVSDSMTRVEKLPPDRKGLPCDERQRLQLHFSRNLVDWCFAGCLDSGAGAKEWRHSCRLAIGGSDLYVVCCSGHPGLGGLGYTDRITFHAVPGFRELAY